MSCLSCDGAITAEAFTQNTPKSSCDATKNMSTCLWDCQGQFVCQKNTPQNEVVSNKEMMLQAFQMKNQAQFASAVEFK